MSVCKTTPPRYALLGLPAFVFRLVKLRADLWLPGYLRQQRAYRRLSRAQGDVSDVMVLFVDHFEPSKRDSERAAAIVADWCRTYESIAAGHADSDGRPPAHTWFYRYDFPSFPCVQGIGESVFRGFGEIEFHLHHGYDTPESFAGTLREGVRWFSRAGAMISLQPRSPAFAYIAGNWALDNGRRNPAMSGVNTELSLLSEAGCYADFTYPAIGTRAQPAKVNAIYYATDTPKPKSYTTGVAVAAGRKPGGDLMIFQGPVGLGWSPRWKRRYIEQGAFEEAYPYWRGRIGPWLRAGVHVEGRPRWLFVKIHTHGMQSRRVFLSRQLHTLLSDWERHAHRRGIRLHYVTAREAYNIVKAAEAGQTGDAGRFRDYVIPQPVNRHLICTRPVEFEARSGSRIQMNVLGNERSCRVRGRGRREWLLEAQGLRGLDIRDFWGESPVLGMRGEGRYRLKVGPGTGEPECSVVDGALPGSVVLTPKERRVSRVKTVTVRGSGEPV